VVLIRFGRRGDPQTAATDVLLHEIAHEVWLYCAIYSVDLDEVHDFTEGYELYDPATIMCFYRNRPLQIDVGYGPDAKVTWPLPDGAVLADAIIDAVHEPAALPQSAVRRGLLGVFKEVVQGLAV